MLHRQITERLYVFGVFLMYVSDVNSICGKKPFTYSEGCGIKTSHFYQVISWNEAHLTYIITWHNFPYYIYSSAVDCFIVSYSVYYFSFLQDAYLLCVSEIWRESNCKPTVSIEKKKSWTREERVKKFSSLRERTGTENTAKMCRVLRTQHFTWC